MNFDILLVEDDTLLCNFIVEELDADYKLAVVPNGQAALDFLQENSCRLILSDLLMPIMSGFELLERLKKHPQWQNIPVIVLSSLSGKEDRLKVLRIGIDDFLPKPFYEEELKVRVDNLIRRYEHWRKLLEKKIEITTLQEEIQPATQQNWLREVEFILQQQLQNSHFGLEDLSKVLNLSARQVRRRIKQYSGLSYSMYLREIRLHEARNLLLGGQVETIAELCALVGYEDTHYFSKIFEQHFGRKPMSYLR
ncbi:response regulator [Lewinella sp. LCG006]|uniref:response regulator n=1 Tax=Lewinella sp. LCG006 TaxID=3231911 RepID=UPI0034600E81